MDATFPTIDIQRRFISVTNKVRLLSSMRKTVSLPAEYDISEIQWAAIVSPLMALEAKLHTFLKEEGREYLTHIHRVESQRGLAMLLGRIELELSKSFIYFDTFVDLLSQRHLPEVGLLLAGCDVLAGDALKKNHPALSVTEKPLVSFNRGFGASILREGVPLPDGTPNPLATIQIPYTKLKAKYNLTSIIHEAGHLAMVKLGLVGVLPKAIGEALAIAGAPTLIQKSFALWCKEIGPDFWGFCNCGAAQASSIMEILTLPQSRVFNVSTTDPHPPPFLRVLLAFEWCRQQWGNGNWDEWQRQWLTTYPLDEASSQDRSILATGTRYLSTISRVLFRTQFSTLGNRAIPSLFELDPIAPMRLERVVRSTDSSGVLDLSGLSPCGQLALFRTLRNRSKISEQSLDRLMTAWLISLARGRKFQEPYS